VPDVSDHVTATPASLGAALLCVSLGALATMRLTGALCDRLGPGLVSALAAALLSATVAWVLGLIDRPMSDLVAVT
jgi:hypothetical protein